MLIDEVEIKVTAGKGGDGAVAWSKIKMSLGPTGGAGGKGGDVYCEAVADLGALRRFRAQKVFAAENGQNGRGAFRDGHAGKDLLLLVPRGTVVKNISAGTEHELTAVGERLLVAKGGKGGRGNFHFRSSTNTSPKESERGLEGENAALHFELKLIADIGLIGFPNIGKSSFLNAVTNAQSRVANYQFTTLEPHLGVYGNLVLADIPGLIEGASTGKGLGIKFLRHIERTRVLFHFIDATDPEPQKSYKIIRQELKAYNPSLLERKECIILSRTDMTTEAQVKQSLKALAPLKKEIMPISIHNKTQMTEIRKFLDKIEKELGIVRTST